jgi:putative peptidoglycan lipid II flippase
MVASTVVTVISLPIYNSLYNWYGATGLALASDIGIAMQTLTIAVLLHKRRMVSLASLDYAEMGRCLLAAIAGGAAAWLLAWGLGGLFHHLPSIALLHHARYYSDAVILIAGAVLWTAMAKWVLEKAGSALPKVAMRRLGMG